MTSVVDAARRAVQRRPDLPERLRLLGAAADAARGRVDDAVLARADDVVRRAAARLSLAQGSTVVALAGATGSGKSSTFNALVGEPVAAVGVRRPTTSVTTAAVWGQADPAEVLAWLEVTRSHRVAGTGLDGLVLLDLPDHDSTEIAHRVEVDRLVRLVDLFVWVVDPQKYADEALHARYLQPLRAHRDVMLVVLNHVDEVPPDQRPELLADVGRLLAADGLDGVPVLATSALTGEGVEALRARIAGEVRAKRAATARLGADVDEAAAALRTATGTESARPADRAVRTELVDALADAAGVPTVVRAVERAVARRGDQRTGWPVTAWLSRLRPDPLRRLHLDLGAQGRELTGTARASTPEPTRVQRARVDLAVRAAADRVGDGLPPTWADAVRRVSVSRLPDLDDALDRAVAGADLGASGIPVWWRLARLLQLLLLLATLGGGLWLLGLLALDFLQLPSWSPPEQYGLPLPTLLLLSGVGGGIALGILARVVNRFVARSRGRRAGRRLRAAVAEVADELVLTPLRAEVQAHTTAREALAALR